MKIKKVFLMAMIGIFSCLGSFGCSETSWWAALNTASSAVSIDASFNDVSLVYEKYLILFDEPTQKEIRGNAQYIQGFRDRFKMVIKEPLMYEPGEVEYNLMLTKAAYDAIREKFVSIKDQIDPMDLSKLRWFDYHMNHFYDNAQIVLQDEGVQAAKGPLVLIVTALKVFVPIIKTNI